MWYVRRREECLQVLGEKPELKMPSGRHRHSWQHNIKMEHQAIKMEGRGLESSVSGEEKC